MARSEQAGERLGALLGMEVGRKYTVTRRSRHREFQVGDCVWLTADGCIECPAAAGWMPAEDVLKATRGWRIEPREAVTT